MIAFSYFRESIMTDQVISRPAEKPLLSKSWRFALIVIAPLVIAALALGQPWADPVTLLSDPFDLSHQGPLHPLMGSLSTLGVTLFLYAAAVTLFGATLVNGRAAIVFLLSAGLLSSLLAHDDLFGLHEVIIFEHALDERAAKFGYLGAVFLYLMLSWRVILRLNFLVLGASFACFAASWGLDSPNILPILQAIGEPIGLGREASSSALYFWEDGSKLAGAALWLWFHVSATGSIVRQTQMQP